MNRTLILAGLALAAVTGSAAQAGATSLYPEEGPQVRAERPDQGPGSPRWDRAPRVQCSPSGAAEGFTRGFEAEIDRGFDRAPAPRRIEERRAERPVFRLVGTGER